MSHFILQVATLLPFALLLDIHEERVGALHKALPLVLALVKFLGRVEQIDVRLQHLHTSCPPKVSSIFRTSSDRVHSVYICQAIAMQASACRNSPSFRLQPPS